MIRFPRAAFGANQRSPDARVKTIGGARAARLPARSIHRGKGVGGGSRFTGQRLGGGT
jgi:hypothetical protein